MFEEIAKGSFANLTPDQRTKLAELLRTRAEYLAKAADFARMRVDLLENFTPEKEAGLEVYSSAVLAPMRSDMSRQITELLPETVDVEQLKSLMPLVVAGMLGSVNFALLTTVIGIEPDQVSRLESAIMEYTKRGI